jgi:hypothetical protein
MSVPPREFHVGGNFQVGFQGNRFSTFKNTKFEYFKSIIFFEKAKNGIELLQKL